MSGVQIQKTDKNSLELAAVSLHTLGRFHEALEWCVGCKLAHFPTRMLLHRCHISPLFSYTT
jgi:hypothetical protein